MARNYRLKTGFTILEVLISFVLLIVGSVVILSLFSQGMIADDNIEHSTVALALAQGEMELIKNAGSWPAIDSFASPSRNLGGKFADYNQEVLVNGVPKNVQVVIYWNAKGVTQDLELDTLLTDYNY